MPIGLRPKEIDYWFPELRFPEGGNTAEETMNNLDFWKRCRLFLGDSDCVLWLKITVEDEENNILNEHRALKLKEFIQKVKSNDFIYNKLKPEEKIDLDRVLDYLKPGMIYRTKTFYNSEENKIKEVVYATDRREWQKRKIKRRTL